MSDLVGNPKTSFLMTSLGKFQSNLSSQNYAFYHICSAAEFRIYAKSRFSHAAAHM